MPNQIKSTPSKSLRIIDVDLFHYVTDVFYERHNIHSYDLDVLATPEETGLLLTFRFGEDFTHSKDVFFTYEALTSRNKELEEFLTETADECKDVMVKDYFRMMKP